MGFEGHRATLRELEFRGWTEGMVGGAGGRPLLLFFAPVPDVARAIRRYRGARYDCRFPAWLPHWGDPADTAAWPDLFRPFVDEARPRGATLAEALAPQGYTVFWEDGLEVQMMNGHCAVTRGYDDTLLRREPQLSPVLPDRDGATLEAQMASAVRQGPEHVLVYGWNEYFEHSVIEPTQERGARFADLARRSIATAQTGHPFRNG